MIPTCGNHTTGKDCKKRITSFGRGINATTSVLDGIQIGLNTFTWIVMNSCIALDFLFTSHGGVFAIANSCSTRISDRTWLNRLYITIMKKILVSLRLILMVYEIGSWPGLSDWNSWFKHFTGTVNYSCCYHNARYVGPLHSASNSHFLIYDHRDYTIKKSRQSRSAVDCEGG